MRVKETSPSTKNKNRLKKILTTLTLVSLPLPAANDARSLYYCLFESGLLNNRETLTQSKREKKNEMIRRRIKYYSILALVLYFIWHLSQTEKVEE